VTVITALPNTVDKSLIICMDCHRILSIGKILGYIDLIIIIANITVNFNGGRKLCRYTKLFLKIASEQII